MSEAGSEAAAKGAPTDAEVAVRALLDAAGIDAPEQEVAALARVYPGVRRQTEALYRVPTEDDAPATMLHAELGS
jgi:hypothetical protein